MLIIGNAQWQSCWGCRWNQDSSLQRFRVMQITWIDLKTNFRFVFNSSSQRHSWGGQLDGVHGAAYEDPDVWDNSQDPGDGMPARPCERFYMLLLLIHSMSLILSLMMRLLMRWSPETTSNILERYASNGMVLKQDSVGWITLTCPNTQSFTGWPVQLHTKGRYPTAKGERNGKWDNKKH